MANYAIENFLMKNKLYLDKSSRKFHTVKTKTKQLKNKKKTSFQLKVNCF